MATKPMQKCKLTGLQLTGEVVLHLAGLFFVGLSVYWFFDEIGLHGRIARWDLAITVSVAGILGLGLLLRPTFLLVVALFLLYVATLAYQIFVRRFQPQLSELLVFCAPLIVVLLAALFRFPSAAAQTKQSGEESPTEPPGS